jgi:hypothetical protein
MKQSATGFIKQHLTEIAEQRYRGYSQELFIEKMQANGIEVNLNTFRVLLHRVRKSESVAKEVKPVEKIVPISQPTPIKQVESASTIQSKFTQITNTRPDIDALSKLYLAKRKAENQTHS